jgi:hypothetical protein
MVFPGSPPGWAFDVTGTPRFDCSRCGAAHATFPHLKKRLLAGNATLWRAG